MNETIFLGIIAVVCIASLAVVSVFAILTFRRRADADVSLVKRLSDQLISNSDYQVQRLQIEAQIVDTKEKARVAAAYTDSLRRISPDPAVNGYAGGERPDFTTTPSMD